MVAVDGQTRPHELDYQQVLARRQYEIDPLFPVVDPLRGLFLTGIWWQRSSIVRMPSRGVSWVLRRQYLV